MHDGRFATLEEVDVLHVDHLDGKQPGGFWEKVPVYHRKGEAHDVFKGRTGGVRGQLRHLPQAEAAQRIIEEVGPTNTLHRDDFPLIDQIMERARW
jgi:hypothetical protein